MTKVVAGFFSFTEITDPGEHHSYNEWHQLDHMPEQFPLPGIAYGQRWVSTPACRAARAVSGPRLDPIHYVTLYLMTEPLEQTIAQFMQLGRDLHKANRFHQHRTSHLSGSFGVVDIAAAPRVLVSPEAIPYRPHREIYVVVEDVGARRAPAVGEWCEIASVAGAWSFADDARRITVAWCDAPTTDVPVMDLDGVEFGGAFETITPWEWNWFD